MAGFIIFSSQIVINCWNDRGKFRRMVSVIISNTSANTDKWLRENKANTFQSTCCINLKSCPAEWTPSVLSIFAPVRTGDWDPYQGVKSGQILGPGRLSAPCSHIAHGRSAIQVRTTRSSKYTYHNVTYTTCIRRQYRKPFYKIMIPTLIMALIQLAASLLLLISKYKYLLYLLHLFKKI